MPPAAIAVAALAATAIGTGVSVYENAQAAGAQQRAAEQERDQNNLQAERQQLQTVRQARIAYANSQQAANNQGVALSSTSLGGLGSIQSQLGGTLSFLDQYNQYSNNAMADISSARSDQMWAQTGQGIANLGSSVFREAPMISQYGGQFWNQIGGGG